MIETVSIYIRVSYSFPMLTIIVVSLKSFSRLNWQIIIKQLIFLKFIPENWKTSQLDKCSGYRVGPILIDYMITNTKDTWLQKVNSNK